MSYLKHYTIDITTIGPLFIGSGEKLIKKEYALDQREEKAYIPDLNKLFELLRKKNLIGEYETFLLGKYGDFNRWLIENGVSKKEINEISKYCLDCRDVVELKTMKDLLTFIKDSYGKPYVPGSSLKGAIRSALLAADILKNSQVYAPLRDEVKRGKTNIGSKNYLKNEITKLEQKRFHKLDLIDEKGKKLDSRNAAASIMKGLLVSDSNSLPVDALTLCQKVDVHIDGVDKDLPILRECIKPNVTISFELTIDETVCDLTIEDIKEAIELNLELYNRVFLKKFKDEELYNGQVLYLGGGAGFLSKTVIYSLLENDPNAVEFVSKVIDETLHFKQRNIHKHFKDKSLGVSPHTCKLTEYGRKLLQMGACHIEIH